MDQVGACSLVKAVEKGLSITLLTAGLAPRDFAQRVMAGDEVFVALMEEREQPCQWHSIKLAVGTPVTVAAGQKNEVPDLIDREPQISALQDVRKEVIDVG